MIRFLFYAFFKLQVNHNDTLIFPKIVICNLNPFRKTQLAERQLFYDVGRCNSLCGLPNFAEMIVCADVPPP